MLPDYAAAFITQKHRLGSSAPALDDKPGLFMPRFTQAAMITRGGRAARAAMIRRD